MVEVPAPLVVLAVIGVDSVAVSGTKAERVLIIAATVAGVDFMAEEPDVMMEEAAEDLPISAI